MADSKFLKVAKKAAQEAGKVVLEVKQRGYKSEKKGKRKEDELNIVTAADVAAERVILAILGKEFPKHAMIAEEESTKPSRESDYLWAVDPIDGTLAFARNLPYWGVSISLLRNHEPAVGVIFMPELKELFWAERGKGSFLNGERIRVSKIKTVRESLVYMSPGPHSRRAEQLRRGRKLLERCAYLTTFGAAVAGLTSIASGRVDVYLPSKSLHIWDVAAGALLVEEAGGKVTDFTGNPVDWAALHEFELVATNGIVHDEALKLLNV